MLYATHFLFNPTNNPHKCKIDLKQSACAPFITFKLLTNTVEFRYVKRDIWQVLTPSLGGKVKCHSGWHSTRAGPSPPHTTLPSTGYCPEGWEQSRNEGERERCRKYYEKNSLVSTLQYISSISAAGSVVEAYINSGRWWRYFIIFQRSFHKLKIKDYSTCCLEIWAWTNCCRMPQ